MHKQLLFPLCFCSGKGAPSQLDGIITTLGMASPSSFGSLWISGWVKKGWMNSRKEAVLNRDLWERLLELSRIHRIEWVWVRGHNGHPENERCDALARAAIEEFRKKTGLKPV